jgi:hypothetical protein
VTTSTERMPRVRQRRREGRILMRFILNADGVSDLVTLGWLQPGAPQSAVRNALIRMIGAAFDARVRPDAEA